MYGAKAAITSEQSPWALLKLLSYDAWECQQQCGCLLKALSSLLQILYGNLAPEGCVAKITGKEGLVFEGPAKVYDSEEDMLAALSEDPTALKVHYASLLHPECLLS